MGSLTFQTGSEESGLLMESGSTFGSAPQDREVLLMQVGRRDGLLRFLGEIPAAERRTARCLRWVDAHQQERTSAWWEVNVRTPARTATIKPGHWLALAQWPWSRGQVDFAEFKRGSKKGKAQRPQVPEGLFDAEGEFFAWIASQSNDYWEKGNSLTATIARPTPLQHGDASLREAGTPLLVFGLCQEPGGALADELFHGLRAAEMLRRLNTDVLAFWPKAAAACMETLPKGAYDEVKEMGPSLLHLAIRLALAGPEENSERWVGRLVMDLADAIFRNLINLQNRRAHARRTREDASPVEDVAGSATEDWADMP